jgi:inner membrane protein
MAAGRFFTNDAKNPKAWRRAAFWFSVLSLGPDLDAIGFHFGIQYGDQLGHRGASHSIALALALGVASYFYAGKNGWRPGRTAAIATVVAVSHGLLDTMTFGGGLGCALLWPFSAQRYWAPETLRIIPVAPIGVGMLSLRGLYVVGVELVMFAPLWLYAIIPRRRTSSPPS